MPVRDRKFDASTPVRTDGGHFIGCTFESTTLTYGGGEHPKFEQCSLNGVNWHFTGEALRTIQFLQLINASPGGPAFVGELFRPGVLLSE
jgi:hypothetical protein